MFPPQPIGYVRSPYKKTDEVPKQFLIPHGNGGNAICLRRETEQEGVHELYGAAFGIAVEPGFELLEPLSPIDVAVGEPRRPAPGASVDTDVAGVLQQAGGFIEIGQVVGVDPGIRQNRTDRSEEHTSELQSLRHLVCRLLLEKKTIKQ